MTNSDTNTVLLSQIIQANPLPFFVINSEHVIVYWSKGCEQLLGKSAEAMLGTSKQWAAFYPEERATLADYIVEEAINEIIDGPYSDKQIKASASNEGAFEAVDYFPAIGKEGLWLHFTAAPIRDAGGKIIGAIETLQNVSQQHKVEIELKLSNSKLASEVARCTAELAESHRQLEVSLLQAEETNRLRSIFLATLSNELQAPLNGILGFAGIIKMDPRDDNVVQYATVIEESGRSLLRQIEDLHRLSEIAAGNAAVQEDQFCPNEVLESVLLRHAQEAKAKGIALLFSRGEHCPELMVSDSKRFMHCLDGMLDSVVRCTEVGSVSVKIDSQGACFQVVVSSAPGSAPASAATGSEHLAGRSPDSVGLGLALVRAQAEIMQGTLQVQSKRGEGTTLTLSLPITPHRQC